jgi:maleate isomerase
MYGHRLRIGLLVPSSNTTMETEFWRAVPAGVSVHSSRMKIVDTTIDGLEGMDRDLETALDLALTAGVGVICYGCTTGSLRGGNDHERALVERIEKLSGVPAVTTASAVVEQLRRSDIRSVAVATPYVEELNELERCFLENNGFRVVCIRGLGIRPNLEIGRRDPQIAYRLAKEVILEAPEADALFISCTNFPTLGILKRLRQELGRPVISSNQASLAAILEKTGIPDKGWEDEW